MATDGLKYKFDFTEANEYIILYAANVECLD